MTINIVAALSGAIAAFAALIVATVTCFQLKQSRFALGVDIILKLEQAFDATDMRAARTQAATALKASPSTEDLEEVLDFFETLGVLVRRGAVDEELAWNSFSHWVLRYADLAREQIHAKRKAAADETYYAEFDLLVGRMTQIEMRKRRLKAPPFFPSEDREAFLAGELTQPYTADQKGDTISPLRDGQNEA